MQNDSTLERDGVVIDVAPEHEPPPAPAAPSPATKTGRGTARFALALALLTLLAVGAALLFGFQHWQAIKNDLSVLDAQLRQTTSQNQALQATISEAAIRVSEQQRLVETQAGKLDQTFERQRDALQRQQTALERHAEDLASRKLRQDERESQVRAAVADLHRRVGGNDAGWIAAEAEYLLRLADQRLRLARDLGTARSALELADQRLRATGDPRWSGVRERIARQISAVDAVVRPDIAGLSARLSALIETVPGLRFAVEIDGSGPSDTAKADAAAPADLGVGKRTSEPESAEADSGWRGAVDELWRGLKGSVRIQRRDRPVQAMPAARQREFFYQNLKLNLESARLALVSGADKLYRDSLSNSLNALEQHFDPADSATRSMRAELQSLAGVEIKAQMPDISDTLRALQAEEALQRSVLEVPVGVAPATPASSVEPSPNTPETATPGGEPAANASVTEAGDAIDTSSTPVAERTP